MSVLHGVSTPRLSLTSLAAYITSTTIKSQHIAYQQDRKLTREVRSSNRKIKWLELRLRRNILPPDQVQEIVDM